MPSTTIPFLLVQFHHARKLSLVVVAFACQMLAVVAMPFSLWAETGDPAWLRYDRIDPKIVSERFASFPAVVVVPRDSEIIASARDELVRGVRGMLERTLRIERETCNENSILLATFEDAKGVIPTLGEFPNLPQDGFWLKLVKSDGHDCLLITAPNDRGVLYGVFTLLRIMAIGQPLANLNERHTPAASVRMVIHWDRLDGTVPGGNGEKSLFWEAGQAIDDERVRDYARLLSSVGINGISLNEPNAGPRFLAPAMRKELARLSDALRPWGLRVFIAFDSTSAPVSGEVSEDLHAKTLLSAENDFDRWKHHVAGLYEEIPELGGFVLDTGWMVDGAESQTASERAQAINTIAAALRPHGGMLICRTCICRYENGREEGNEPQRDPAKIAYELFQPLDGQLDENVVLQVKHGPMDFQVREPPSPLLGALEKTNQAIEFQLTQQHLGQQRHMCFLVPMWKQVLEFDMQAAEKATPVKELVAGRTFQRPLGGFVAVSNARRSDNWFGHEMAPANLYGFGRLAWNPDLSAKALAEEWTRLTFGQDPLVVGTLVDMLLKSWRAYEDYTGSLGAGTFTDVANNHYGPAVEARTTVGWTTWHDADAAGIGKDRTAASGTGFVAQYRAPVAARFESLETCPDELLLFMHRVPYAHLLKSGKTVIQHIYDSHYQGAREAGRFVQQWEGLQGRIDGPRYQAVLRRLQYQSGHAQLWRDAVCIWFLHTSGIADSAGRVGNYPNRFEAESLHLEGYEPFSVIPWETASGGECVQLSDPSGKGSISMKYEGEGGWFDLFVRYFDENDGQSRFRLLVAGQMVDEWVADDSLPDNKPNGHTSTRRQSRRIALRHGDEIRIEALADGSEYAAVDYLEFEPAAK